MKPDADPRRPRATCCLLNPVYWHAMALAVTLLLPSLPVPLRAQTPADVNSVIYRDLDRWEVMGLAPPLPHVRPYPLQTLRALLELVRENALAGRPRGMTPPTAVTADDRPAGSATPDSDAADEALRAAYAREAAVAQRYLDSFGPERPTIALDFSWQSRFEPGTEGYEGIAGVGGEITAWMADTVTATGVINPFFIDRADSFGMPVGVRRTQDWIEDWSDIDLLGRNVSVQTRLLSTFGVGLPEINFQAGYSRTSIGPFFDDGLIISNLAPSTAQFLLSWHQETIGYQLLFLPIAATNHQGAGGIIAEKFLMYHGINWRPLSWFEIAFFESVVWGGRFEWRYLVPLSSLFLSQGSTGFGDNTLMGFATTFRPAPGWRFPFQVYVDDFHFNDFVRLQWDTKYKLSAQLGGEWVPAGFPELRRVRVDYTAVMPYMYTHFDENTNAYDPNIDPAIRAAALAQANYSNYTHAGTTLGPGLRPNSDRLRIDVDWEPLPDLRTNLSFRHIRHGNASAGISDGDGSIFDPGYIGSTPTFQAPFVDPTGQPYTRFLTQEVLESTAQIGIDLSWRLPLPAEYGRLSLTGAWMFQHIANAGLQVGAVSDRHFLTFGLNYNL